MTTTLPALLAARVAATPDAPAFHERDANGAWQPVAWRTFGDQQQRLRRSLAAAGLQRGDRVALIAPVSLRWELVHHAVLAAGGVIVGLDAHDLPERVARMVEQADIVAFVVADLDTLRAVDPGRLAAARFVLRLSPAGAAPAPNVRLLDWDALTGGEGPPPDAGEAAVRDDDLATIIFTSGTTGQPRGIAYTHAQVRLATSAIGANFPFVDSASRLLCWLPLSNLFQRIVNLAAMQQGASTHLLGDPRQVMQVVGAVSPDIFVARAEVLRETARWGAQRSRRSGAACAAGLAHAGLGTSGAGWSACLCFSSARAFAFALRAAACRSRPSRAGAECGAVMGTRLRLMVSVVRRRSASTSCCVSCMRWGGLCWRHTG